MKRILSHFSYLAFFLFGAYLAFCGVEDFGLLLFGKLTDATVLSVSNHRVRVGKRGHAIQHYAKYEFVTADNERYNGSGDMDSRTPAEKGTVMKVRYLSFDPSVNRPKDDVLHKGVLLTLVGVFLSFIVLTAWRRKVSIERAASMTGSDPDRGEKTRHL